MIIKEGQIWEGFHSLDECITVRILEIKDNIIGYHDDKDIYFMEWEKFEKRFECKG